MPFVKLTKGPNSFAESLLPLKMLLSPNYSQVSSNKTEADSFETFIFKFRSKTGKFKWIREESLADIASIEMVDLPLADSEGAIEKQMKNAHGKFHLSFNTF